MEEPAVHRTDERVAVRRGCGDGDGLHPLEQSHDLLGGQRVPARMDDPSHVGLRPCVAAIDERLQRVELRGGLTHRGIVSARQPTSESSGGPRNTTRRAGSTQNVSGKVIRTGRRRAWASA